MVQTSELTSTSGGRIRDRSAVHREKRVADAVAAFLPAYDRLRDGVLGLSPSAAREGLALVRGIDIAGLAEVLSAPALATASDIVRAAGTLIAVTKHLDKVDGQLFQDTLVAFIADEQPTRLGLGLAMRRVILSSKFTPSIAEVIEALRSCESELRSAQQRLQWLPDHIHAAESFLGNR